MCPLLLTGTGRLLEKCIIIDMERFLYAGLKKWKDSKTRKPLILEGARQVGPTFMLPQQVHFWGF